MTRFEIGVVVILVVLLAFAVITGMHGKAPTVNMRQTVIDAGREVKDIGKEIMKENP